MRISPRKRSLYMFETIFETSLEGGIVLTPVRVLVCSVASIILGIIISFFSTRDGRATKNFAVSVAVLPLIVQAVITAVNGNLGYGVAVLGAFSLVRFRSVAGNSRDISTVFLTVAVGLLNAMGYIAYSVLLTLAIVTLQMILSITHFGENNSTKRYLRVTLPETLDYSDIYTDVFEKYTVSHSLEKVKTTNLGSMFELSYNVTLKKDVSEKDFLDEIRVRNGNLTVVMSRYSISKDEL